MFGWIRAGGFTLRYLFTANFLVGSIIILTGLVVYILPIRPKLTKLIDHTNYAKTVLQKREEKRKKAYEMLYLGMCIILLPAVLQLLLSFIL